METEKKVIDASIIAKWFLNEPNSDKAIKLRDEYINKEVILITPELAFVEVINVLRYKGGSQESLSVANKSLWDLQLKIEKLTQFLMEKAAHLSIKYNVSIYDSLYIAIANIYGISLVTADKKLADIPNVTLLD